MSAVCCPRCAGDVALVLSALPELRYGCQACSWRGSLAEPCPKDGELLIATLDGEPVTGAHHPKETYTDDARVESTGTIGWLYLTWMGESVSTDGQTAISLPDGNTGMCSDITLPQYGWLKEAVSAGVIDRLVALAQIYVDQPWPIPMRTIHHQRFMPPQTPKPVDATRAAATHRAACFAGDLLREAIDSMSSETIHQLLDALEPQLRDALIRKAA